MVCVQGAHKGVSSLTSGRVVSDGCGSNTRAAGAGAATWSWMPTAGAAGCAGVAIPSALVPVVPAGWFVPGALPPAGAAGPGDATGVGRGTKSARQSTAVGALGGGAAAVGMGAGVISDAPSWKLQCPVLGPAQNTTRPHSHTNRHRELGGLAARQSWRAGCQGGRGGRGG